MSDVSRNPDFPGLTAKIVVANLANNTIASSDVPRLIDEVHRALTHSDEPSPPAAAAPTPAVPIRHSVTRDYLICLEDGRKMRTLKRYLMRAYSLTPEQYRERWGLPPHYPMVAPNYGALRSTLAKQSGLGHSRGKPSP